jgi:hypothetical protein
LVIKQDDKERKWQNRTQPGIEGTKEGLWTPAENSGDRCRKWVGGNGDIFYKAIVKEPIGGI